MKISSLQFQNFKRFTDLKIEQIPATSKLVLLIGSNGSGKSSVFDGFEAVNNYIKDDSFDKDYYKKNKANGFRLSITLDNNEHITASEGGSNVKNLSNIKERKPEALFYGRSSFRQVPRLTRKSLGKTDVNFQKDTDRPRFYIDRDDRFENDIEKITEIILKDLFRSNKSNEQIKEKYIDPINQALANIFGSGNGTKLQLIEIIPPLEGNVAQINFRKGDSEIHYDFLSAGEKEVFNLLINLLSRRALYQDTIYFFDEIDLHLNTRLQYNLLKEVVENWLPGNCQLWTASHSLGFIEYAKQSEHASIIDFNDLDFDYTQVLSPEAKDRHEVYEIAVGKEFLPSLFQDMTIVFVENKDRDLYAGLGLAKTIFVADNNRNNVYHKVRTTSYKGIVDRDFLSDDDRAVIMKQYSNLYILSLYSIENYLYHPDNLKEYYERLGKTFHRESYIDQLTIEKNKVKDSILLKIVSDRLSYPYFGEPAFNDSPFQKRFKNHSENHSQSEQIQLYLSSNDFYTYYKSLPMKSYCTQLGERQNLSKSELIKTSWFKAQIKALIG